jgi:uncharacterized protein (DUF1501 family)
MTATLEKQPTTTTARREPALVVVQLNGGNDGLNTVVPFGDSLYYDYRPTIKVAEDDLLHVDARVGLHPSMAPLKTLYDEGKFAVFQGIGYPDPSRSHFTSMGIWQTADLGDQSQGGWLAKAIHDLDPKAENPVLGMNFGRTLPRALQLPGVPVASVDSLDTYGVLTGISSSPRRASALETLTRMYAARDGQTQMMAAIGQTGLDAQRGADLLRQGVKDYVSTVDYPANNPLASSLKGVAQVLLAGLGTRVFYTQYGSFDTHANQVQAHAALWTRTSEAIAAFFADLRAHNASEQVVVLVFSEFGRTVKDNGSGTDHGAGSVAFVLGDPVKGGLYGQYPSLRRDQLLEGDLGFHTDFRSVYATLLERWMGVDSEPIVQGTFEQFDLIRQPAAAATAVSTTAVSTTAVAAP